MALTPAQLRRHLTPDFPEYTEENLLAQHKGLVGMMVRRYSPAARYSGIEAGDLRQAALIGLLVASRNFDGRGKFSTYAVPTMKHEMFSEMSRAGFAEKERVSQACLKIFREHSRLSELLGREPTTGELAEAASIPAGDVRALRDFLASRAEVDLDSRDVLSLDSERRSGDPSGRTLFSERYARQLWAAINRLDERERDVLLSRIIDEQKLADIARSISRSRQRTVQILNLARQKVRRALVKKQE